MSAVEAATARCRRFQDFSGTVQDARARAPDSEAISSPLGNVMFNTQFQRPATVLLSAMWSLAAVLAIAAFAVSAFAAPHVFVAPASQQLMTAPPARSVESVTKPSMLREPRLAISKDKLD